jgi:hypothetical protein
LEELGWSAPGDLHDVKNLRGAIRFVADCIPHTHFVKNVTRGRRFADFYRLGGTPTQARGG